MGFCGFGARVAMPNTSWRLAVNGAVFAPVVVPGAWSTTAATQEVELCRKPKPTGSIASSLETV